MFTRWKLEGVYFLVYCITKSTTEYTWVHLPTETQQEMEGEK